MVRILKFGFKKKRDCIVRVAKTKALTAKLICAFVFAYANCGFFDDTTKLIYKVRNEKIRYGDFFHAYQSFRCSTVG